MKKLSAILLAACTSCLSVLPASVILIRNWDFDCNKQLIAFVLPFAAPLPNRLTDNRMIEKPALATILIGYKQ